MSLVFCFLVHYWLCDLTGGSILVHFWSSFLSLYDNLFSHLASKCWPNYCGIMLLVKGICSTEMPHTVADPDLQIRGARSSRPWDKGGGGWSPKKFFLALQSSVWSKNKGGPDTSPRSATAIERGVFAIAMIYHMGNYSARILGLIWPLYMDVCHQEKMALLIIVWINADF